MRAGLRRLAVPMGVFILLSVSACCAETPIRRYTAAVDLFVLVSHEVDSNRSSPTDLKVEVAPETTRFILTIQNLSPDPIILEPKSSVYVDEAGRRHSLKFDIDDAHRPSFRISPGSTLRVDAAPKSKIIIAKEHCFSEFTWVQPLVPWSVSDASEQQVERQLEELARMKTTVGLVLGFVRAETPGVLEIRRRFIVRSRFASTTTNAAPGVGSGETDLVE